jgi:hypothetical protein
MEAELDQVHLLTIPAMFCVVIVSVFVWFGLGLVLFLAWVTHMCHPVTEATTQKSRHRPESLDLAIRQKPTGDFVSLPKTKVEQVGTCKLGGFYYTWLQS